MNLPHTSGPWRWEINRKSKSLHLVGGRPMFDLTLLDFERWGMGGATIRLRDTAHDGMNIMHKLHERPDWIAPFHGREHHAHWCADVIHPDARLIASAPDLLDACVEGLEFMRLQGIDNGEVGGFMRAAIAKATGAAT
jgi:hypothetical protein